jgi:hypothetical protein
MRPPASQIKQMTWRRQAQFDGRRRVLARRLYGRDPPVLLASGHEFRDGASVCLVCGCSPQRIPESADRPACQRWQERDVAVETRVGSCRRLLGQDRFTNRLKSFGGCVNLLIGRIGALPTSTTIIFRQYFDTLRIRNGSRPHHRTLSTPRRRFLCSDISRYADAPRNTSAY